ncbi:hypothetical protein PLEOSDRAFT_1108278 [Pleurotus ostreatus PC15]|uniref:Uncharacterized protein n=1 Tax=Pleurotus ostreatus (strain PC15) TaxID=1137138 RepID=A0A067NA25_PLEO1|nr:hypothetical protein PLEOSDRAFT_1108278 [Pleurotus ostreatus PC15]
MSFNTSRQPQPSDSLEFSHISPWEQHPCPPYTAPGRAAGGSINSAFSSRAELNTPPPVYFSPHNSGAVLLPSYSPQAPGQDLEHGQIRRGNLSEAGPAAGWPVTRMKILKGLGALGLVVGLLTTAVVVAKFVHEPDPPR